MIKFITVGDERGAGGFLLCGPEAAVSEIGSKLVYHCFLSRSYV